MASRLEKHEKFILDQLLLRRSYESIARDLAGMDCKTSRQNLMVWVKNRAEKLKARRELTDPLAWVAPVNQPPTRPAAPAAKPKMTPVAPTAKASTPSKFMTKEEEEKYLNEIIKSEKKKTNSNLLDGKK